MKSIVTAFFILASIILFIPHAGHANTLPHGDFGEQLRLTGKAIVSEVINPLTVRLDDGRSIHLAGLDIPDLDYYHPGELSVTAVEILSDFLTDKRVYIYQSKSPKEGRMNRLGHHIAHLVRIDDNVWAQGLLLSLGVARVRTTKYNPEMAEQMLALEEKARKTEQGLWSIKQHQILTPAQAKAHIGSYKIVEGQIYNVSQYKNRLYLNFGMNWKEDFTVSISSSDLRQFAEDKRSDEGWKKKNIRVRGWIESYNGPYIKIDHPERLEIIASDNAETEQTENPEQQNRVKTDNTSGLPNLNP